MSGHKYSDADIAVLRDRVRELGADLASVLDAIVAKAHEISEGLVNDG